MLQTFYHYQFKYAVFLHSDVLWFLYTLRLGEKNAI